MKHSLKNNRYRICFQTRNKVWIYKNSRLRYFYKIRSRIILKIGRWGRKYIALKNMKWTVARRQMVPYFRKTRRYIYYYKKLFFTKQQLKNFYGRLKEYQIRNFFKQTWNKSQVFRTNIFIGSLEQRVSVILFRMRLLPTIFACNQLIQHRGIMVNNQLITYLYFRVNLGDVISIPQTYWFLFYRFLYERLCIRFIGEGLAMYRRHIIIKKLHNFVGKDKTFFFRNFKLISVYKKQIKKFIFYKNFFKIFLKKISINKKKKNNIQIVIWIKFIYWIYIYILKNKLKLAFENLKVIRLWGHKNNYLFNIRNLWQLLNSIKLTFNKFAIFLQEIFLKKYFKQDLINPTLQEDLNLSTKLIMFYSQKKAVYYYKKTWLRKRRSLPFFKSKFLKWTLRQLKYKKSRNNFFKQFKKNLQWYTPKYLEIDYNTLRATFVYYPESSEVFYAFPCSFKKIVSFYKERAL